MGNASSEITRVSSPSSPMTPLASPLRITPTTSMIPDDSHKITVTPTQREVIRNLEAFCDRNQSFPQLCDIYGPFVMQMSPDSSTLVDRTRELDKISKKANTFYTANHFGIKLYDLGAKLYFWDNRVAIVHEDNHRVFGVFERE
jgi:hypothetical protein